MTGNPQEPQEYVLQSADVETLVSSLAINAGIYTNAKSEMRQAPRIAHEAYATFLDSAKELADLIEANTAMSDLERLGWLVAIEQAREHPQLAVVGQHRLDSLVAHKLANYRAIEKQLAIADMPVLMFDRKDQRHILVDAFRTQTLPDGESTIVFPVKNASLAENPLRIAGSTLLPMPDILSRAALSAEAITPEFGKEALDSQRFMLVGGQAMTAFMHYLLSPSVCHHGKLKEVIYHEAKKADIDLARDSQIAEWLEGRRREIAGSYAQNLLRQMRAEIASTSKVSRHDRLTHLPAPSADEQALGVTTESMLIEADRINDHECNFTNLCHPLIEAALEELIAIAPDPEV